MKAYRFFFTRCFLIAITALIVLAAADPAFASEEASHGMTERMMELVLQLAAILIAAKAGGYICERFFKIPSVLGELGAGIIIGPYALGPLLGIFTTPAASAVFPVSPELYGIATVASVLLLYLAGLETDLSMFLRYSVAGSVVGICGVVFSFALGDAVSVWCGIATGYMDPIALFLGTISTATSVGITARILSERNRLTSPEGVTILSGAVIDDVLGIIILAVVVGMAKVSQSGGVVQWGSIGLIAGKAFGFWIVCTAAGLALAPFIGKGLEKFGSRQTMASLSLGLALLLAGLSEKAGLAMIIGAYITGLSFSRADCARELQHRLEPVYQTLVSVFFCVMGMLVNIPAMRGMLLFGLLFTGLAIIAKVFGCGLPLMCMNFNFRGAMRVGIGMIPRGEVALIVTGIGLTNGIVSQEIFGVSIMMTLITTMVAPLALIRFLNDKPGLKVMPAAGVDATDEIKLNLTLPEAALADLLLNHIVVLFAQEDCYVHRLSPGEPVYQVRRDDRTIIVKRIKNEICFTCGKKEREFAKLVLVEAAVDLVKIFQGLQQISAQQLRSQIMGTTALINENSPVPN